MGRTFCSHSGVQRPRRIAAERRFAGGGLWQGPFRLHRAGVFPPAPGRRPGRVSSFCQPHFAGEMMPEPKPNDERTGFPGLRTWCGVYVFVMVIFAVWVALLIALTRAFS